MPPEEAVVETTEQKTSQQTQEDVGERLAKGTVFSAIDYDPEGKGDVFTISYGDKAPLTTHVVNMPLELWQAQNEVGKVISLEIIDAEDGKLVIEFL